MTEVVEINRIEELEAHRPLWDALLSQTPRASFFQSLDWLQTYWRHFGAGQRLRVLIVGGQRPLGIVPLTVVLQRTRIGRLKTLTYPLHDWGSLYGPLGPDPRAALTAALGHIRRTPRDWDMLDLRWMDDQTCRASHEALQSAGFSPRRGVWAQIALLDLSGSWEHYFAARTCKFRNHLRRCEKRVARLGHVVYRRFRPLGAARGDGCPRLDLYDACVEVARRSWQGRSRTGTTLSHDSVREFLRQCHVQASKAGAVDLNLIELGDRPIAFAYNYRSEGYLFGVRAGYDPEFAAAGVGHALFAMMVRDSFQRGDHAIDLGPLYLETKKPWLTRIVNSCQLTHYPIACPRAQVLRMKHWLCGALSAAGG